MNGFSFGFRAVLTTASLALALAPIACNTSSSGGCTNTPPTPTIPVQAPCGLAFASVATSGACQSSGTTSNPSVTLTGNGTCTVNATFSNGAHATGSVTYWAAADCAPEFNAVTLTVSGSSGCDASDAGAD